MTDQLFSGVLTTLSHRLPMGLDGARLAQWQLREGLSYAQYRADLVTAMDALNEELLTAWGRLISITTEDHFEYPNGGALKDMPRITSSDRGTPRRGNTVGHMIDLYRIGDAVGGDETFFRDTRLATWMATIQGFILAGRNTFEKDILNRFFNPQARLLGTNGYDVGFVNASQGVPYIPPGYNGKEFDAAHTHYLGFNSSSGDDLGDMLNGLMGTIAEHGHTGPYTAMVSAADVPGSSGYRKLPDYIKPVRDTVVYVDRGGETSGNTFFERGQITAPPASGGYYIGGFQGDHGECDLYATSRLPAGYAGMYAPGEPGQPNNPIAVRVHPDVGFGFFINEKPSFDYEWPVEYIYIRKEYGVSCNGLNALGPRTTGAAGRLVAGGVYTAPTIS